MSNDLRQVSELFRDLVSLARAHKTHNLDGAAEDWLKEARISILKDIEQRRAFCILSSKVTLTRPISYHNLSANATNPLLVPYWAINPSIPLSFYTPNHPRTLDAYSNVFLQAIRKLMDDCGFVAEVRKVSMQYTFYVIDIRFLSDNLSEPSLCDTLERLKIHQRFTMHITEDTQEVVTSAE